MNTKDEKLLRTIQKALNRTEDKSLESLRNNIQAELWKYKHRENEKWVTKAILSGGSITIGGSCDNDYSDVSDSCGHTAQIPNETLKELMDFRKRV